MARFALIASGLVIAATAAVAETRIPVCDEFLAKWDECVKRLPEFLQNDASIRDGKMRKLITGKVKKERSKTTERIAGLKRDLAVIPAGRPSKTIEAEIAKTAKDYSLTSSGRKDLTAKLNIELASAQAREAIQKKLVEGSTAQQGTEELCRRQMEAARKGELFSHYGCRF